MSVLTINGDWLTINGEPLTIGGDERVSNIRIDFGVVGETTPGNWNNVTVLTGSTTLLAAMIDSNGNPVAISLDSENAWTASQDRGAPAVGDYPLTATTDVYEVNSETKRRNVFTFDAAFIGEDITLRFFAGGVTATLGSAISLTDNISTGGNFIVGTSTGVTNGDLEDIPYDPTGIGQPPLDFNFVVPATGIVNLQVGRAAGGTGAAAMGVVEFIFPDVDPTLTDPYGIGTNNGPLFCATSSDTIVTVEAAGFLNNRAGWASLVKTGDVLLLQASNGTKLYTLTVNKELRIITLSTGLTIA